MDKAEKKEPIFKKGLMEKIGRCGTPTPSKKYPVPSETFETPESQKPPKYGKVTK